MESKLINRVLLLGLSFFLFGCVENNEQEELRTIWLKDYAFCKCQLYGFGEELKSEIFDKDVSLSILADISDAWYLEEKMDSLVAAFVNTIPKPQILDYQGKKPITFKCLEFRRSKELDDFILSLK